MTITTIAQVPARLQALLGERVNQIARQVGLVQRDSKLTGAKFVQTLVFGWLAQPAATGDELAESAEDVGVSITGSGLRQRMTAAGAQCLRQVLEAALCETITASEPLAIPILQRFTAVELQDSTQIPLPADLADEWPGGSGAACLKVQTRWDVLSGALHLELRPGREHDQGAPGHEEDLPPRALRLRDLGYFGLDQLAAEHAREIYWVSRYRLQTQLYLSAAALQALGLTAPADTDPERAWEVLDLLRRCDALTRRPTGIDVPICLGAEQRLPCRLLAVRVPRAVARLRRQRLHAEARRKGQPVSARQLALAAWTILVTNVPPALLSLAEALVLYRLRWQIELLFKLWKDKGKVDEWRSELPRIILCQVYAKLVGLLLQHWLLVVCGFQYADRSLVKAARVIRHHAAQLASDLDAPQLVERLLQHIQRHLQRGCRMNPRRTQPNTYQRLLALTAPQPQGQEEVVPALT